VQISGIDMCNLHLYCAQGMVLVQRSVCVHALRNNTQLGGWTASTSIADQWPAEDTKQIMVLQAWLVKFVCFFRGHRC